MKRRAALLMPLAAALVGACGRELPPAAPLPAAPTDVALVGLDGQAHRLSQWRGRRVVLNVWASWCAPCRAEMASLQALAAQLDAARAVVIGLSVDDDLHLVREYLRSAAIRFPVYLQDADRNAQRALDVRALPATLLVDADGRLQGREEGARDWTDRALHARWNLPLRAANALREGDG